MAKISKIYLKNYKSLRDVELELKPLNILIGTNGSGKSNLLDFFRLLKDAANGQLSKHINREGGFGDVMWWGKTDEESFEWNIHFSTSEIIEFKRNHILDESIRYQVTIKKRGSNYGITHEEITSNRLDKNPLENNKKKRYLHIDTGLIDLITNRRGERISDGLLQEHSKSYKDTELYITQLRDLNYPALSIIREILDDFVIYRSFGNDEIENVYQAQTLDALYPLRLEPDLSNLASILHALQNDARYETALADLTDYLNLAFPEINKFDTPQSAAGKIELRWRNKDFQGKSLPAFSMSDGMIRFLGLATLLVLPDPPSLIAIDEPEIGLHPKLIPLLASLLKEASKRTQIVVTTHSPELLNSEAITLDDIVLVNKEDGATTFERPDAVRLERWLENYSIGQLWMIGKLGQHS